MEGDTATAQQLLPPVVGPAPGVDGGDDVSLAHLIAHLSLLEGQVAALVTAMAECEQGAHADPLYGLYVSADQARRTFSSQAASVWSAGPCPDIRAEHAAVDALAERAAPAGQTLRLREISVAFGLDCVDTCLLLAVLAPELDPRFERWYGYLNGDVTARWATVRIALQLSSASVLPAAARSRFGAGAPLIAGGLVHVHPEDRPLLTRGLRVPERVVAYLLGDDALDAELGAMARLAAPPTYPLTASHLRHAQDLAKAVNEGARTAYVQAESADVALDIALAALATPASPMVVLHRAPADPEGVTPCLVRVVREARLRGCAVVVGPDAGVRSDHEVLTGSQTGPPVVFTGNGVWDPTRGPALDWEIVADRITVADRAGLYCSALAADRPGLATAAGDGQGSAARVDALAQQLAGYRLTPSQIAASVETARRRCSLDGVALNTARLQASVRAHNGVRLERLARHVVPQARWADLVLEEATQRQLHELADRVRQRGTVLGTWRMRPGGVCGTGVSGLFAGASGTGKTLAAEVLAGELGLDLYVVDLAMVMDKYIGETEKHLEQIFTAAEDVNGILLFDEADALFGRRSETRDAHDRYANMEVAYLLQRLEAFRGLALMTTNLYGNVDPAFTRRLDAVVHFPTPDAAQRRALWDHCLGPSAPRAAGLPLAGLADAFELSGGSIRSCALTAAYRAAAAGRPITTGDLTFAVRAEYRKFRRLIREELFAPFADDEPPAGAGGLTTP